MPALSLMEPLGQASFVVLTTQPMVLRASREPVVLDNLRDSSILGHMLLSQDRDTTFVLDVT
jgi:hypothetical protein